MGEEKDRLFQLRYTEKEWLILEEIAQQRYSSGFRRFLNYELHKLAEMEEKRMITGELVIIRRPNQFFIPNHLVPVICAMAKRYDITLPSLISRMIVHPELKNYYTSKGF